MKFAHQCEMFAELSDHLATVREYIKGIVVDNTALACACLRPAPACAPPAPAAERNTRTSMTGCLPMQV